MLVPFLRRCVAVVSKPSASQPYASRLRALIVGLVCACTVLMPVKVGAQIAHFSSGAITLGGGYGSTSCYGVPFGSFVFPAGIAVDASGNVFVENNGASACVTSGSVQKIPPGCHDSSCVSTLAPAYTFAFIFPAGIAVDGSGNVFLGGGTVVGVEDNARLLEIPVADGYSTVNFLGPYPNFPYINDVAVDGNGNLFVNNNDVGEILATGGYTAVNTLVQKYTSNADSTLSSFGVAVDTSNNVFTYITNSDNNTSSILEIMAAGGYTTVHTFPLYAYLNPVGGIAVDANDNFYFTGAWGNTGAVYEALAADDYTTVKTLFVGRALDNGAPQYEGIAVDRSGNVFVADLNDGLVLELQTGAADFGTVAVGQVSPATSLAFTFDIAGTIGGPVVLTQGATSLDFADARTGSCTTNGTSHAYNTGDTCTVDVIFSPAMTGQRNGAVLLKDSSGNTIATAYVHGIGTGPQVSFLPGSQSTLGGGFVHPTGVAVDGNGNVFVADNGNSAVKEILATGGYATVNTLASGIQQPGLAAMDGSGNVYVINSPAMYKILAAGGYTTTVQTFDVNGSGALQGVAVDGSGNVFVAFNNGLSNDGSILEVKPGCVSLSCATTLASGLGSPYGIAVDGSGNVFFADNVTNAVYEILAAGGYTTVKTLASSFSSPAGVAVDGIGNVYVADYSADAVYEILAANGYATVKTLASSINEPTGVAVDGRGNVYVTQNGNSIVLKLDYADGPTLTFPTAVDTTDGPQTLTVQNVGNAPLTFQPFVAGNLLDAVLTSSGETDCTLLPSLQLAAGSTCTIGVEFAPAQSGPLSGYVNLTDNALNAASPNYATQTIAVQGTGQAPTVSLASSPNPSTFGQVVSLTATVSSGATGTVTFNVDNGALMVPVTIQNSSATMYSSELAPGTHTITAAYSGDTNWGPSNSSPLTQTVTGQGTPTVTVSSSANPVAFGQVVAVTAQVYPPSGTAATGTVTFNVDNGALVIPATIVNNNATMYSSQLAPGSHTITAAYSGDSNWLPASSAPFSQTVTGQGTPTVTVSSSANPVAFGQVVAVTAQVYPPSGTAATGTVTFNIDNGWAVVPATIRNNVATMYSSQLAPGPHTITASYGGDSNWLPASAAPFSQTVGQGTPSVTLISSANPSTSGQVVAVTATISDPSGTAATGTVTFNVDNGWAVVPATVQGNIATMYTSELASGSHTITASYSGDSNWTAASAAPYSQSVN